MARTRKALAGRVDVAHLIGAGVLVAACPRPLIDEVLAQTGKASQRQRQLPASAVVYYVMALALWREMPLEEVLRVVCEGLHWLGPDQAVQAGKSAISQARTRLGPEVMELLAARVLRPLAPPGAPGAWYRGRRVMTLDGACLDVADERANADFFGYPAGGAFPQMRVLGLAECGTHAIMAARTAPHAHSEQAMAAEVVTGWLSPEMLVLAGQGFYSFKLWRQAAASGAMLLWRVKASLQLPVVRILGDGTYLSTIHESAAGARREGTMVRVIEYALSGSATPAAQRYRLLTTALDETKAPGQELAALCHAYCACGRVFDAFKTHLRGASTVLRSKTPPLVRQELWGLLLAHFAVRQLMVRAGWRRQLDPDRLGFGDGVRVIKRRRPQAAA